MIAGGKVILRPAIEADRQDIYEWLVASDVTSFMMGPPTFPNVPIPTWDEFCADYAPHFFDGSRAQRARSFMIVVDGEPVGHISYDGLDASQRTAELDIWMRCQRFCGQGYGSDALRALVRYLHDNFGATKCIVRPSRRNGRAVQAYKKAGFRLSELSPAEQAHVYGTGEYSDTITLEFNS